MPAAPISKTMSSDPIRGAVEILEDRLYYVALKTPPRQNLQITTTTQDGEVQHKQVHFFNIDSELVYWNFFLDFGPLNLGQLYRFCTILNKKLDLFKSHVICFYSSTAPAKRANAIYLICAWQVLYLGRTPEESFRGFMTTSEENAAMDVVSDDDDSGDSSTRRGSCSSPPPSPRNATAAATVGPLPPFHDASPCACTYDLNILDCLNGLSKARMYGFFDFNDFDVEEYEHFEQVENGDLNWIIKDRILAFAGPHYKRNVSAEGYCTLTPADYIPYFTRKNVALVVRLNKKCYDEEQFIEAGIRHLEQYYLDGSCPPLKVLKKVVAALESVPSNQAVAIHCKAGLGRTGTCIGAYIMKHYKFTAAEVIAWMRICRPGCVIGPQQHFLQDIEQRMWHEGSTMKKLQHQPTPQQGNNEEEEKTRDGKRRKSRSNKSLGGGLLSALHFGSLTMSESKLKQLQQEEKEMKEGRAGQAEDLLARRTAQQKQHKPSTSTCWKV